MESRVIAQQGTLDGAPVDIHKLVWPHPLSWWRAFAEREQERCDWCYEPYFRHAKRYRDNSPSWNANARDFWYKASPWDENETCDKLCPSCSRQYDNDGTPEGFFYCDSCEVDIPDSHGMRLNYRMTDGEIYCVACVQNMILEGTEWMARFADGEDLCPFDFYNRSDLTGRDFEEWEDFSIHDQASVEVLRQKVKELIEQGKHVAIDQGSTPIFGTVPVTIWIKEAA